MYPPPQQVVTRRGANHTLHIIMSVLTCGLWAVTVWPIAAIMGRKTRSTAYGAVPPQMPQGYYPPPGYQQPPPGWGQQQTPPPPPPGGWGQQPPQ